jgi:hypothetical protein
MNDRIILYGKIVFDVPNKTKKHEKQGSWKCVAMILFNDDSAEYYAWFLKKRYSIILNKPLRDAHVTFINDRMSDMTLNGQRNVGDVNKVWSEVKTKWNDKEIEIVLDLNTKTDSKHWWLNVPEDCRDELQGIRNELGLGRPYFGLHMSLGYANEKNINHSDYIHTLIKKGYID